jgi:ketosteroid isomerase-like protein
MKTILSFSILRKFAAACVLMLSLTATSFAQSNSEISADVRAEVEKLNKNIEQDIANKDFSSIVDLYADDATIIAPGGKKIQGRKAIAEYWYSLGTATSLKSEIIELGGNGKVVYQLGKWTVTSVKNGTEQTTTSDVVIVWKKNTNYEYKIQLNSSNNAVAVNGIQSNSFEAAKN